MRTFIRWLLPPRSWTFPVIVLLGIIAGCIILLIHISRAGSYLTNDPSACVNCHIMSPYYATWSHSSHREVATCNECHVPHNNLVNAYYFKAKDGLRHATIFTLRNEPQVIFILEPGKKAVQSNCIKCHEKLLTETLCLGRDKACGDGRFCWECHREVPHGRVNSLSSVPFAPVPRPSAVVPSWLIKKSEN
ncbi:MAG: cytochrome c nitrite reductase small subunit [Lentimicrobiaceae bacterium]|nr:cytochrome c nitrite reductase small subunit [Lentimicrobiaceae bacterium]